MNAATAVQRPELAILKREIEIAVQDVFKRTAEIGVTDPRLNPSDATPLLLDAGIRFVATAYMAIGAPQSADANAIHNLKLDLMHRVQVLRERRG